MCSCFISDLRLLIGALLGPMAVVLLLNITVLVISFRIIIIQNRKRFFQGGKNNKNFVKMSLRNLIALMWLIVLFGMGWVFGLLTIREASKTFQYLFVIANGFQGFYFFIFICLSQTEGRKFWKDIITKRWFKVSKHTVSHSHKNTNDDKVHGGNYVGKLSTVPTSSSENKNNYLMIPNPDTLLCSNQSVYDSKTLTMESVCEVHGMSMSDSRIEVTTFFDGKEEINEREDTDNDNIVTIQTTKASNDEIPSLKDAILDEVIEQKDYGGSMDVEDATTSGSQQKEGIIYVNPEVGCEGEKEERAPVPPQRRKRKSTMKPTEDPQQSIIDTHDDNDVTHDGDDVTIGELPRPPRRHKRKAGTTSAAVGRHSEPTPSQYSEREDGQVTKQISLSTVRRQGKVSQQRISRQKKIVESFHDQAPFEIVNPLCAKEE